MATLASDTFTRTSASSWGAADVGGTWTTDGITTYAVTGSAGTMAIPAGATGRGFLAVASSSTDVTVTFSMDKGPTGSTFVGFIFGRGATTNDNYQTKVSFKLDGTVSIALAKVVGGVETLLTSTVTTGLSNTPGTVYAVRMQTTGTAPTSIRAKIWIAGQSEPSTWAHGITDAAAALQVASGIGVGAYIASSATNAPITLTWDNLVVTDAASPLYPTSTTGLTQVGAAASLVAGLADADDTTGGSMSGTIGDTATLTFGGTLSAGTMSLPFRAKGNGGTATISARLYAADGATAVAAAQTFTLTAALADFAYALTQGESDALTGRTGLVLKITQTA